MRFVAIGECMVEMAPRQEGCYALGFAGDTLNTAYYARIGLAPDWQVEFFTALGQDPYSGRMLEFFASHDIATPHVPRLPGTTCGLYLIHQEDGDRQFTYWRGASAARRMADDAAALSRALHGADLCYFSGISLAILPLRGRENLLAQLEKCAADGATIAFDPNIRPALWASPDEMKEQTERAARLSGVVLPSFDDEQDLFGDPDMEATIARYQQWGAREVVVKNAAGVARAGNGRERIEAAPLRVDAIDATGAGDSFNGAYLAERIGAGADMTRSLCAAHQTAARVVTHSGALVPRSVGKEEIS